MKRVPISECPAGPWLDAAVAKAIGYEVNGASVDDTFYPAGCIKSGEFVSFNRNLGAWWSPSTDITAAWELVEEGDLLVENFLTKNEDDKYVICHKYHGFGEWPEYYEGNDEDVSLVIARAFLRAKGVEYVEIPE